MKITFYVEASYVSCVNIGW